MAKSRVSSLDTDGEWKICGMDVEYVAFLVALVGIGIDILIIILSLYASKWYIAVLALIFLVINSTVLLAKGQRHRLCYCPYLFTNIFGLLLSLGMALLMIYNLNELPEWWMQWVDPVSVNQTRDDASVNKVIWTTSVLLALFIAYFLLYAFFQYVIWKAYRYMKRYPHGQALQNITTTHDQGRLITTGPTNTTGQTIVTVEEHTTYTKTA
uniref:Uncharacterized protein n=1 Tax=Ditylenchus dipsaci TaxID=166011 RepID=A0A915EKB6_9BILA